MPMCANLLLTCAPLLLSQPPALLPAEPQAAIQPAPTVQVPDGPPDVAAVQDAPRHTLGWPEVWGLTGLNGYFAGTRTAPNGLPFHPLFSTPLELNLGLLPHKKLYFFADLDFWAQRATDGVTNPHQGGFDFSKREFDVTPGLAWNYWGPMELRAFGFAYNNLNRGTSPNLPFGYNDGVGIENRWYLPTADPYDVAKLSFLSAGYLPSKTLVGIDGQEFNPGLFLRAYLTWDLPAIRSYLYSDGRYFGEGGARARLLYFDGGVGIRPFPSLQNLEFRLGGGDQYDVEVGHGRAFGYGAVRLLF